MSRCFARQAYAPVSKTIQDTLSKTDTSLEDLKVPTIQLNQQININNNGTEEFDRDSRKKIIDTVNQILNLAKENSQNIEDVIELSDENIEVIDD